MAEKLVQVGIMRGHSDMVTETATATATEIAPISSSPPARLEAPPRSRRGLRHAAPSPHGPFALRSGRQAQLRRPLRPLCFLRRRPPPLGTRLRHHHHALRRTLQRRALRRFLPRQPPDRLCLPGSDHQDLEHSRRGPEAHTDWVSCVCLPPSVFRPTIISGSWDQTLKIWNLTNCNLRCTLTGHAGYVNTVTVSPDASLLASGGKDGMLVLWDLAKERKLYCIKAGSIIHALCFCPTRYWVCAATDNCVKILDLETKQVVQDLTNNNKMLHCTSLAWSFDGNTFFTGYTDGTIKAWKVTRKSIDDVVEELPIEFDEDFEAPL
ncbi:hypothetical protein LUZ63_019821 [Rhynchospora breviuscula]|uniref:Guanine nucleotide-binding protein subunit beta-like protein n=1 Tax=Rhynchospora breviuscula TaxID=2022672 RepID=A0A9Q0C6X2_9POAL|nr:hypothetical protein LUZ63_019821 [Rhynchospora breviuscula]